MVREGQGLDDIEAHHGANVGVLEQDYLPLSCFDLRAHSALLLSLEAFSSRCPWSALPTSSRCGCTRCRRRARSPLLAHCLSPVSISGATKWWLTVTLTLPSLQPWFVLHPCAVWNHLLPKSFTFMSMCGMNHGLTSVRILLSLSPPITPIRALALRTQTVLLSDPSRNPTLTRLRDC
jgi:hypothetical protein